LFAHHRRAIWRCFQEIANVFVSAQETLDTSEPGAVIGTGGLQISRALSGWQLDSLREQGHIAIGSIVHEFMRIFSSLRIERKELSINCLIVIVFFAANISTLLSLHGKARVDFHLKSR